MIRYVLKCDRGHEFESWFASSSAYDALAKAGQVTCAACGSPKIGKAPMTPSVVTSERRAAREQVAQGSPRATAFRVDSMPPELREALRRIRDYVKANADYVGPRFAEEARKIHYEEAPSRGIYGEATIEDVRALRDEGIEFHPLPILPEDRN